FTSYCLGVLHFEGSHTADNITEKLQTLLSEFFPTQADFRRLVAGITSDNAANIVKALSTTPSKFGIHQRCFAHTLQLCVLASVQSELASALLKRARDLAGYFRNSNLGGEALTKAQDTKPAKKLILDC